MDYTILNDAYQFYRSLENRLRIVHNRTEGEIVRDSPELLGLAKRLDYTGEEADEKLLKDYLNHANKVRDLYEKVIGIRD